MVGLIRRRCRRSPGGRSCWRAKSIASGFLSRTVTPRSSRLSNVSLKAPSITRNKADRAARLVEWGGDRGERLLHAQNRGRGEMQEPHSSVHAKVQALALGSRSRMRRVDL